MLLALAAAGPAACVDDATDTAATAPARQATQVPSQVSSPAVAGPAHAGDATCAAPYPALAPEAQAVLCTDASALQPAELVRVIDGDTIVVRIGGVEDTVRLYGIDTAERGQVCFREAADRLGELAAGGVRLVPDARNRDRYGRLLRYVYTTTGASIDARMVAEGLAHAWRDDGALRGGLIALEERARASRTGCLWG
jgi:micrococcal nuclease